MPDGQKWGVYTMPTEVKNKVVKFLFHEQPVELNHGSVVIAAIMSCTNTSNPSVMLGAGLVAKKACELGLQVKSWIKTSLAPGSGVVTKYLLQSGLQKCLNEQGFHIVGYGYTTCIGNSGDLDDSIASAISENANYLASPPLVLAYALTGTGLTLTLPIGVGKDDKNVYFKDIWPSTEEVAERIAKHVQEYLRVYNKGKSYPRYFKNMTMDPSGPNGVNGVYCLLNFGDSITMDHISPVGSLNKDSPATKYLLEHRVERKDFNSYGSCRGNDEVMARGIFVNIRIVNKLLNGEVGPKTLHVPTGEKLCRYKAAGHDTIVLVGAEYGSGGSSRDWATKGPMLLGVKAMIVKSFERIYRSNLVGMGIVPFCFKHGEDADSHGLTGHERYTIDLPNIINEIRLGQDVTVRTDTGKSFTCTIRFDTE
ncbi:unnamed protein product [Camellia sinensis]